MTLYCGSSCTCQEPSICSNTITSKCINLCRGEDVESHEMLRQGFTHSFLMTFNNKEEFTSFLAHPKHVEFSATFSQAIDKVILLDFPTVLAKPVKPAA